MRTHFLPIILAVILLMAMFVSYSIAVSLQHVPALLPYISDTGVLLPERSVFSQLINTAVILQLLTFYVRFEQLKMAIIQASRSMTALISDPTYMKERSRTLFIVNRFCLWLGFTVSFGLSLIGNFQLENPLEEDTIIGQPEEYSSRSTEDNQNMNSDIKTADGYDMPVHDNEINPVHAKILISGEKYHSSIMQKIHWTGAFFAFVGGLLWMFVQGWLSLHTCIHPHSHLEYNNKKPEIEQPKAYVDIRDSRQANDINLCDKVICKSGCRLRAIVRLIISALGFTFLVCGIVVSLIDTSGMDVVEMVEMENGDINPSETGNSSARNLKQTLSITAAFCEWFLTLLIVAYMLTFVPDFKHLELGRLNLEFNDNSSNKKLCHDDRIPIQNINSKKLMSELPKQQNNQSIIKKNTSKDVKSYLCSNYQTWSSRKQKNVGDMQVLKYSSYRDVVGPHDMSLTLSTSSSYMSDSRTTNASIHSSSLDHQQCRHPLLDDSEMERGSNYGSEIPNSSLEGEYRLHNIHLCDTSKSRQHTPTVPENPSDTDIISIFSEQITKDANVL